MTPNKIKSLLPNGKSFDFFVSIDDAHEFNIELGRRLVLAGITPTFFIETGADGAERQIKSLNDLGCEIGSHTVYHPADIKRLEAGEIEFELSVSKAQIEEWTGKTCKSLCYPRGRYNESVIAIAKNVGYEDARTTLVCHTKPSDSPFKTHTTIHAYDGRDEYKGRPWWAMADFYLDHVGKVGGYFHLWGHAKELLRDKQVEQFIEFCKKARSFPYEIEIAKTS